MNNIKLSVLAVMLLALAGMAWSQTGTSRIAGTVSDSSGAVVAGATVTAIDEATNAVHRTVAKHSSSSAKRPHQ